MPSSEINHLSQPCIYGHALSSHTERKSRFMKWLSKFFKSGADNRGIATGGQQPQFTGDENMGDRTRANRQKEELDRAIALSMAEDIKRPNGNRWQTKIDDDLAGIRWQTKIDDDLAGNRWQTKIDEDLARSLNDDFNSAYPPYNQREHYPQGYRMCGGCKHDIGYGNYLGCMGTFFHPDCFRCHACGYPITEHEFSLSGKDTYHKSCFKELTHPKCEVCHQFIPTNGVGLIEYRCHPFWSQKYCPSHEHDNTARCCSCERLESWSTRYISLGDGRSICLECMESAIMDTGDCQPLYHAIRDYYEGMNMRIDQQIPMLLVERQALNEAIEGEKLVMMIALFFVLVLISMKHEFSFSSFQGFHHMPETRGLCLSEEQTVTSVQRRPRMERRGFVGIRTQPQKLSRKCEVTAILVLYGLPRLLTGAILAHELMHGWLRLNGYRNLTPEVEEGICQVLSHLWLESEVMPGTRITPPPTSSSTWSYGSTSVPSTSTASSSSSSSKKGGKSSVETKLGEFFMHQIVHDASPAYGGGYRSAMEAVNKYGLRRTLDHIRYTGTFPE